MILFLRGNVVVGNASFTQHQPTRFYKHTFLSVLFLLPFTVHSNGIHNDSFKRMYMYFDHVPYTYKYTARNLACGVLLTALKS